MAARLNPNTAQARVYALLLTHEYMAVDTIEKKLKIKRSSLSGALTTLRRAGLAEYSGTMRMEGGLRWKKHPLSKPLYPAQPDLVKRKNAKPESTPGVVQELAIDEIIDRIMTDCILLKEAAKKCTTEGEEAIKQLSEIKRTFKL